MGQRAVEMAEGCRGGRGPDRVKGKGLYRGQRAVKEPHEIGPLCTTVYACWKIFYCFAKHSAGFAISTFCDSFCFRCFAKNRDAEQTELFTKWPQFCMFCDDVLQNIKQPLRTKPLSGCVKLTAASIF
jgi:hypothetical protein